MAVMGEIEAQQIITANAAYQIVGCDLCPFFKEDIEPQESVREGTYNATRTA